MTFYNTEVPRGTETYKRIYNQRTATERINSRILNDYGLHRMMIHTKKHYSFMTTMIGICIHLDARYKQAQTEVWLLSALYANAFKPPFFESLKTMPFFILLISYSLFCKWFRIAVLPADKELYAELYHAEDMRRCSVCGAPFASSSNRAVYCPDCRKRITRRQTAERMRKMRANVTR